MSHLFAYFARMKFIGRWGLMRNAHPENIQEHTLRVAMIAHALALIRNRIFGGRVNAERIAALALYHDVSEVLTGNLPAPVKHFYPDIRDAYDTTQRAAKEKLLGMVPGELKEDYRPLLIPEAATRLELDLIRAAGTLSAYTKCLQETTAGNQEFSDAEMAIRTTVEAIDLPEVRYFVETFRAPG